MDQVRQALPHGGRKGDTTGAARAARGGRREDTPGERRLPRHRGSRRAASSAERFPPQRQVHRVGWGVRPPAAAGPGRRTPKCRCPPCPSAPRPARPCGSSPPEKTSTQSSFRPSAFVDVTSASASAAVCGAASTARWCAGAAQQARQRQRRRRAPPRVPLRLRRLPPRVRLHGLLPVHLRGGSEQARKMYCISTGPSSDGSTTCRVTSDCSMILPSRVGRSPAGLRA